MHTSQLVKLREGQHEAAVGIHTRMGLVLGNFFVPIVKQTIKAVLSIALDFNTYSERVSVVGQGLGIRRAM